MLRFFIHLASHLSTLFSHPPHTAHGLHKHDTIPAAIMASASTQPQPNRWLRRHYSGVVDAVTKEAVTNRTQLAAMSSMQNEDLLHSFVGIAKCAVRCKIKLEDGSVFPPSSNIRNGYILHLTYNKLVSTSE